MRHFPFTYFNNLKYVFLGFYTENKLYLNAPLNTNYHRTRTNHDLTYKTVNLLSCAKPLQLSTGFLQFPLVS